MNKPSAFLFRLEVFIYKGTVHSRLIREEQKSYFCQAINDVEEYQTYQYQRFLPSKLFVREVFGKLLTLKLWCRFLNIYSCVTRLRIDFTMVCIALCTIKGFRYFSLSRVSAQQDTHGFPIRKTSGRISLLPTTIPRQSGLFPGNFTPLISILQVCD